MIRRTEMMVWTATTSVRRIERRPRLSWRVDSAGFTLLEVLLSVTIIAMLAGRYALAVLALSLAGRFAAMSRRPPSPGTMPSDGFVFGVLLAGTALLLGALNFLPAMALGPIVEHFSIHS